VPWYPYQDLGDGVRRPYLAVWQDPSVRYAAVVAGADGSSLPLGIAEALGVRFDRGQVRTAGGAGGVYQQYQAQENVVLECAAGTVTLVLPMINPHLPVILLGRSDAFDQRNLQFSIEPYA